MSEIERLIKEEMIKGIKEVMDDSNNITHVELPRVKPDDVIGYLKGGFNSVKEDMDTNGWAWDYHLTLDIDGGIYILSGDGWYNKKATFGKKEL